MTTSHDESHEAIIKRIVLGEVGIDSQQARDLLEGCETCSYSLEEYRSIGQVLDDLGRQERDVLTEVFREEPGFDHNVDRGIRAAMNRTDRRLRIRRSVTRLVAAAAVILVTFVVWDRMKNLDPGPGPGSERLGGGVTEMQPAGDVAAFDTFMFNADLPPGGHFVVRIRDAEGNLILEVKDLREGRWTPSDSEKERLPDSISWEVDVLDALSGLVATGGAEAIVSPR